MFELFKKRNKKNEDTSTNTKNVDTSTNTKNEEIIENKKCEITIEKQNGYYKVTVTDYIPIKDFTENEIFDLISNNISWDNKHQKHKFGNYFIIINNNEIYNILINEKEIRIDERIKYDTHTHEKIITYNIEKKQIDYFQCKHNLQGSSYETLYYNTEDNGFFIKELELSKELTIEEINKIYNNLLKYTFINEIINIEELFKSINEIINKKIELTLK